MKVAFWSNARGKSCVTSNLACISVLSAISRPEERAIIFENHQNLINIGNVLFNQKSESEVRETEIYGMEKGVKKILNLVEQGVTLSQERVASLSQEYLGNRLFYLPMDQGGNPDLFEYQMDRIAVKAMKNLEGCSDFVFVDTSANSLSSSRKILQQADMVVVNLNQNKQMISHFFRNYSQMQEKAFYLIGNYDDNSELSKAYLTRKYGIPGSHIGTIPHNVQFSDAVSEGKVIPFLLRDYRCQEENRNFSFIQTAKEAVTLFHNRLKQCEKQGGDAWKRRGKYVVKYS